MLKKIIALANSLDEFGFIKIANELDDVLKDIIQENLCEIYVQSIGESTWKLHSKNLLPAVDVAAITKEIGPGKLIKIKYPPTMRSLKYKFYKTYINDYGLLASKPIVSPALLSSPTKNLYNPAKIRS